MARLSRQAMMTKCARSSLTDRVSCKSVHSSVAKHLGLLTRHSQASFSTASQPKDIAVAADSTVFVAEINGVEAIRSNQRVFELQTKFAPSAVAASGSVVAVGGEVSDWLHIMAHSSLIPPQDQKVRLYDWDGSNLKEVAVLESNKGAVSALAFSPDGSLLAAGDVSLCYVCYARPLHIFGQSSGKVILYDAKEHKVNSCIQPWCNKSDSRLCS